MAKYEIYKKGDWKAVMKVVVFNDPQCLKYTVLETLDKDGKDILNRIKILTQIINQNPLIFDLYSELKTKSPLLEEKVHVDLLKALINYGANMRFALENKHNFVSVAVHSDMNKSQFHSLCSYLINEHKAYDLFSNYAGSGQGKARVDTEWNSHLLKNETLSLKEYSYDEWKCPVFCLFKPEGKLYFETLKMIFNIPGFDVNQTIEQEDKETKTTRDLTLFQIANCNGKGLNVYKLMIEMGADYKTIFPDGFTPLTCAISGGDYEAIDYYLALGFSLQDRDSDGLAPIFYASRSLKMIKYLKRKGADIYAIDNDGLSVFHYSASNVESGEFSKFVGYFGAETHELLNKRTISGNTPLEIRRKQHPDDHKGIEMLEKFVAFRDLLFELPAEVDEFKIYENGDLQAIRGITEFADPNCIKYTIFGTLDKEEDDIKRRVLMIRHIMELNPLILDSYLELDPKSPLLEPKVHVDLLKALIDNGANFRVANKLNLNLLSVAAWSKMNDSQYNSLCFYLINECKANDIFSKRGNPTCQAESDNSNAEKWICPVNCISKRHYFESLKAVFNIPGFNINQKSPYLSETEDASNLTLFQSANILKRGVDVYKLMVVCGADYETEFPCGKTHLMVAVANKDVEAVEYYLFLDLSVYINDYNGAAAMHYASKDLEMIKYVKSLGGNLLKLDRGGDSVFHYSAIKANDDTFSDIVMYFAINAPQLLNLKDDFGETPLDLRKKEHPWDRKGIHMLELAAASIKEKDELSCNIL